VNDPAITPLIKDGYIKLCKDVLNVSQRAIHCTVTSPGSYRGWQPSKNDMCFVEAEQNAQYYRSLQKHLKETNFSNTDCPGLKDLGKDVDKLLTNNLVLDLTGSRPGEDVYKWELLCSEIADEDMPWDPTETDW
jgi:hypothetical protein